MKLADAVRNIGTGTLPYKELDMKSIRTSKTFWVNLVVLLAGLTSLITGSDFIKDFPQVVAILASVNGALGIVLRLVTTKPIR